MISETYRLTPNTQSRVLATCEEHGLDYVTDETNFQPEITLRNALRDALATGNTSDVSIPLARAPFPTLTKVGYMSQPNATEDSRECGTPRGSSHVSRSDWVPSRVNKLLRVGG